VNWAEEDGAREGENGKLHCKGNIFGSPENTFGSRNKTAGEEER